MVNFEEHLNATGNTPPWKYQGGEIRPLPEPEDTATTYTFVVDSTDDELIAIEIIHQVLTDLNDQETVERVWEYIRARWSSR